MSPSTSEAPFSDAVDYWCNAFTPDRRPVWRRAIEGQGLSLKVERDGDEFCDPAAMDARLAATGFATVVLTVASAHEGAVAPAGWDGTGRPDNFDEVAATIAEMRTMATAYPGRFVGMFSVDPSAGPAAVREAEAMLDEPWCVALHNHTHSWDRPFDHADFTPFYGLAADAGVPFVMQAGASGGRFPDACGHPSGIDGPAREFPGVDFVLSHTGWPWTAETIAVVAGHPNVFLGTATWPRRRWSAELLDFVTGPGVGKTMFASGWPTTGHRQAARQFADASLAIDPDALTALMSATARRVFTRLVST